jgi:hypothetical protein
MSVKCQLSAGSFEGGTAMDVGQIVREQLLEQLQDDHTLTDFAQASDRFPEERIKSGTRINSK